jgi:hypothetical protein
VNAREFALLPAEFRASGGYTDPEAAAALGIPTQTYCAWKNERCMPGPFALGTMLRRLKGAAIAPAITAEAPNGSNSLKPSSELRHEIGNQARL